MELLFYWGLKILFWVGIFYLVLFSLAALAGAIVGILGNIWCWIRYHNVDINDFVQKDDKF